MKRLEIRAGERFGRLTILRETLTRNQKRRFAVQCDCGTVMDVCLASLRNGATQSCGCLSREVTANRNRTHGDSATRLYKCWRGMLARCNGVNEPAYPRYGGRGIRVCKAWKSFEVFKKWSMQQGYQDNLTLDRITGQIGIIALRTVVGNIQSVDTEIRRKREIWLCWSLPKPNNTLGSGLPEWSVCYIGLLQGPLFCRLGSR